MRVRSASIHVVIFLFLLIPPASAFPIRGYNETPPDQWRQWGAVAWRYFQPGVAWDANTGLVYEAYGHHYFTNWGLASYIFSIMRAQQLGLVTATQYDLRYRVSKVLDFLSSQALSSGVPYLTYSADDGRPTTTQVTNAADYGRLLIALYLLKQYLLQNGYADLAPRIDAIVYNSTRAGLQLSSQLQNDFYSFYVAQGFKLWGVDVSRFEQEFQALQDGPFVDPSEMYGVEGIPSEVRVNPEVLVAGLLELGGLESINNSLAWSVYKEFAGRVYSVLEARHASTGQLTAWSEGGVDIGPGFVYEWIVDPEGRTWTILDPQLQLMWSMENGPNQSYGNTIVNRLPVAFTKIAFALYALFGTGYSKTLVDALGSTYDSNGFMEGLYETGGVDSTHQVQTADMVLAAAAYATRYSSSTTVTSTSTTSAPTQAQAPGYVPPATAMMLLLMVVILLFPACMMAAFAVRPVRPRRQSS